MFMFNDGLSLAVAGIYSAVRTRPYDWLKSTSHPHVGHVLVIGWKEGDIWLATDTSLFKKNAFVDRDTAGESQKDSHTNAAKFTNGERFANADSTVRE